MRTYVDRLHTYACSQTYIDKHTHTFTHALTQSHACIGLRVRILRNYMREVTAPFPMQLQHPSCHHQLLLNLCTVLSQDAGSYTGVLNRFDNDVCIRYRLECLHNVYTCMNDYAYTIGVNVQTIIQVLAIWYPVIPWTFSPYISPR